MSNLDNLISKIINDCGEKAKQIIDEANKKAAEIREENVAAARADNDKILAEAEAEAGKAAERILSARKLALRDDDLNAKREVIDKVIAEALKKLNGLSDEQFNKFLHESLSAPGITGGELVLPKNAKVDIKALNAALGRDFSLQSGNRKVTGGFVLIREGIESNFTFSALVDYCRNDLESEIIKMLF